MKRIKDTWNNVVDPQNAYTAIIEGTRFKRGKKEVQFLLYDEEIVRKHPNLYRVIDGDKAKKYAEYLTALLSDGLWMHSKPRHRLQFCRNRASNGGKWRDLYMPCLDDHVIAHMLMQANMQAFTRGMHPYCCGSIPNRGISFLQKSISGWMRNDKQLRYFVKLDIRKFFDNIDRDKLKVVLRKKIKDKQMQVAFDQIIDSAPMACPVGYYTSPWFANLYLQDLDWYVEQHLYKERRGKRIKFVKHYLRYVDDIALFGTSKSDLYKAVKAIQIYLMDNYGLEIKPTWEIKKIGKHEPDSRKLKKDTYWLDMGGYKFCKDSTILRDGIYLAAKRTAKKMYKSNRYTLHQSQSIMSRVGWAKHCDSRKFMDTCIKPYVNLKIARRTIGMWTRVQNCVNVQPPDKEVSGNNVILRRNFEAIAATEEAPAHYEYDEWQMTKDQYEVYQNFEAITEEQSDALIELADLISEVM